MISVSLPPVFFGGNITPGELCEAHAHAYWARYNTLAISARVMTSMQRAYSVVDAVMYARTPTVPGMVVTRVGSGASYRLIVAIEGSQTVGNVMNALDPMQAVTVAGCQGHVAKFVKDAYTACAATIDPLSTMGAALSNPRVPVTFTGHSLGGAVAEVWACAVKAALPGKSVRYVSFGSPRVGSAAWINRKNPALRWMHVYTDRDMMHAIPQGSCVPLDLLTSPVGVLNITNYVREETCLQLSLRDRFRSSLPEQSVFAAHPSWAAIINGMRNPIGPTSYWWTHTAESYRNYMMNYAYRLGANVFYRYGFLEFENENQWQTAWRARVDFDAAWNNVVLPGPADATPPTAEIAAMASVPAPEEVPTGQIDPAYQPDTEAGEGGGGDWESPPLVATSQLPQRRVRARQ